MQIDVFLTGMGMSLGLILAIGAQNAFVLRQGLRGEHVLAVCAACALSDALLIGAGVAGFGRLTHAAPWLEPAMRFGGAAFLLAYGLRSLRSALRSGDALRAEGGGPPAGLARTLGACLAITWLNPHVYLDTVVLLGAVSSRFVGARAEFAAGAMLASVLFFFALGYGAAALRPVFARPAAWRVLDGAVALIMWAIAWRLLAGD